MQIIAVSILLATFVVGQCVAFVIAYVRGEIPAESWRKPLSSLSVAVSRLTLLATVAGLVGAFRAAERAQCLDLSTILPSLVTGFTCAMFGLIAGCSVSVTCVGLDWVAGRTRR